MLKISHHVGSPLLLSLKKTTFLSPCVTAKLESLAFAVVLLWLYPRPEMNGSEKGSIQNVYCWFVSRNRLAKHSVVRSCGVKSRTSPHLFSDLFQLEFEHLNATHPDRKVSEVGWLIYTNTNVKRRNERSSISP